MYWLYWLQYISPRVTWRVECGWGKKKKNQRKGLGFLLSEIDGGNHDNTVKKRRRRRRRGGEEAERRREWWVYDMCDLKYPSFVRERNRERVGELYVFVCIYQVNLFGDLFIYLNCLFGWGGEKR